MTGEVLKERLIKKYKVLADVARTLGISQQALNQTLMAADIKTGFIEKLAAVYGESPAIFFEEAEIRTAGRDYVEKGKIEHHGTEYNGSSSEADLRDQIATLKSQLADKERIIQLLEGKK